MTLQESSKETEKEKQSDSKYSYNVKSESKYSYNMKASSVDMKSSSINNSRQEIFDDDSSSRQSDSENSDLDEDYSLEDSYDCEVAHLHDHQIKLAEAARKESTKHIASNQIENSKTSMISRKPPNKSNSSLEITLSIP